MVEQRAGSDLFVFFYCLAPLEIHPRMVNREVLSEVDITEGTGRKNREIKMRD